ncbi:MAG: glycosyl transferase [Burkholderiaceae bacterium]
MGLLLLGALCASAALVAYGLLRTMLHRNWMTGVLDHPNDRSLHRTPVPRIGGVGILGGALASLVLLAPSALPGLWPVLAAAGVLAALGAYDDRHTAGAPLRLAIHLLLSLCIAGWLPTSFAATARETGLLAVPMIALAGLSIAWAANLFNFMDGADGIAGSMALFGFGTLSIAAGAHGEIAAVAAAIAGAAAGFLVLNWHPARMFMGDVGSVPLGFVAASIGWYGWHAQAWPWWLPVLAFLPFIVDASMTLLLRALRAERIWRAHREHLYQLLVSAGLGHARTARAYAGLMAADAVLALGLRSLPDRAAQGGIVSLIIASHVVGYLLVRRRLSRRSQAVRPRSI